jgi:hypothetical protein
MASRSTTAPEPRRVLIAAVLAVTTVLSLAGCPSSGESDPSCRAPAAGSTVSPDDCPDVDSK